MMVENALALARLLGGNGTADDDPAAEVVEDPCAGAVPDVSPLRIASIFILLACSVAGLLPSLMGKQSSGLASRAITLCKTVGTGVVLSCALIHMLLPGVESLTSECVPASVSEDYPALAYLVTLCASLAMHFVEDLLSDSASHSHHHHHPSRGSFQSDNTSLLGRIAPANYSTVTVATDAKAAVGAKAAVEAPCAPEHHHHETTTACETDEVRIVSSNKFVNLVLVELGFSIHSVFVGLAVATAAEEDFAGLLIAICFHQFFEGIAISARLMAAGLGWQRDAIFGAIFSLSGPLGIAIGLFATSASASLNSSTYLITQGVLDCIGAGIMLYLGFSMLLVDFPVDVAALCDHGPAGADKHRMATIMRASMFGAVWAGVIGMAVLGKYL